MKGRNAAAKVAAGFRKSEDGGSEFEEQFDDGQKGSRPSRKIFPADKALAKRRALRLSAWDRTKGQWNLRPKNGGRTYFGLRA
jgi:hypothetical protein